MPQIWTEYPIRASSALSSAASEWRECTLNLIFRAPERASSRSQVSQTWLVMLNELADNKRYAGRLSALTTNVY